MNEILKIYTYVDGVNDTPFPNADNQIEVADFTYSAQRMGAVNMSATLMLDQCYDSIWTKKEYVTFRGEKYYIVDTPSSSKDNSDARYKHEITFKPERDILNNVYFYDIVNNEGQYSSNDTDVIFFGDIAQLASRLNASMTYSGVPYSVVIDEGITSNDLQLTFTDQFIFQVLQQSYENFEIPFYFVGRVIHFGYTSNAITEVFEYGIDNSLLSVTKTNANYKIITRCTGVGSSENIPFYYPNASNDRKAIESDGGTWIKPMQTLMPPIYRGSLGANRFYNAINDTYIDPETGEYYIFENVYDENNPKEHKATFESIKPTIKEITNAGNIRIDQILEIAYDENDNDDVDDEGNYEHPYFFVKLNRFNGTYGFNLFAQSIVGSDMTIEMTSGNCTACKFVIGVDETTQKNPVQVNANGSLKRNDNGDVIIGGTPQDEQNNTIDNNVWIALKKDISTTKSIVMPNVGYNYKPNAGDVFVLTGINLPQAYIDNAENKLKEEIIKYMYLNNVEKFNFSIDFSRIYLAENPLVYAQLNENARVQVRYNDNIQSLYINSYSYEQKKDTPLPKITIEVGDTINVGKNSIQTSIDSVKQEIMSSVGSSDFYKQGLKYFIRKDVNDYAKGLITFTQGMNVGSYVSGVSGGTFNSTDGQTFLEVDKLKVRLKAYFEELEVQKESTIGGKVLITPAGSITCTNVEDRLITYNPDGTINTTTIWDYYKCYFRNEQDGINITNKFVVGDYAQCKEYNLTSGSRYYWRKVVAVGDNYISLSKILCDEGSDAPVVGDIICQLGNESNVERQNALIFSAVDADSPSITLLAGINSYSLEGKDYISYGVKKAINPTTGNMECTAYYKVYGEMYVGDRNENRYIKYDKNNGVQIKGKLDIGTTFGSENRELDNTINDIYRTIYGTQVDISSLDYLKAAMAQNTLIANGLILTSNISLGETISDVFQIRAGINGTMPDGVTNPIMWWAGGAMIDGEASLEWPSSAASSLIRFDGSGYMSKGAITWDKDGHVQSKIENLLISTWSGGYYDVTTFFKKFAYIPESNILSSFAPIVMQNNTDITLKGYSLSIVMQKFIDAFDVLYNPDGSVSSIRANAGLWTNSYLSAKGQDSTGGGGGSDVAWGATTNYISPLSVNDVTKNVALQGHTHLISDITNLQASLDGKLGISATAANSNALGGNAASYYASASSLGNYAPLNGVGASGTWGINISGNAATATNASQLGGQLPSYYATSTNLNSEITNRTNADTSLSNRIAIFEAMFDTDTNGNVYVKSNKGFYSNSFISAKGSDTSGGGSGGGLIQSVYSYDDLGGTYSNATLTDTFNAYTINAINNRLISIESGSATSVTKSGSGNVLSDVSKNGNNLAFSTLTAILEGDYRLTNARPASDVYAWAKASVKPIYTFSEITSKPTTVSGYGITDAITTSNISSQSVAYAANSGLLGGNSASYYASASSLGNYAPLNGVGASGTWGINISGNAATATNAAQLGGIVASNYYHSGNCNNTSTAWSASSLTLNGAITGATNIHSNGYFCYPSGPNYRIGYGTGDTSYIGCNKGSDVYFWTDSYMSLRFGTSSIERLRITGDGNVGIGTTSPAYKLHVAGKGYFSGTLIVNPGGGNYNEGIRLVTAANGCSNINFSCDDTFEGVNTSKQWLVGTNPAGVFNLCEAGSQTAGSGFGNNGLFIRRGTSNGGKLVIANSSNTETSIGYANVNLDATFPIWTVGAGIGGSGYRFGWWYSNVGCKMYLTESGDLNITGNISASGNASISGTLYVNGTAYVSDAVTLGSSLTLNGAITGATNIYSNRYFCYTDCENYYIGYGTGDTSYIGCNAGSDVYFWSESNMSLRFGTSNIERLRITGDGNVGIGTTSPAYKLHVAGVIHSNTGIFSEGYVSAKGQDTTSDMREKINIQPIKNSLDFINSIDIFSHDWKDGDDYKTNSLSAQWLQDTQYNYLVHERNGRLSVDYKGLFMLGLQAIKELKQEIENLKTKIK